MDREDIAPRVRSWRPSLVLAALLAALLVSAPGAMDSAVGGTPFGSVAFVAFGIAFALGAAAVFFPPRRVPDTWLQGTGLPAALLLLITLKLLIGLGDVPAGWHAAYRHADTQGVMHDARFFWRLASRPYRIDPVIGLSDARSDLHFFNDVDLYGYPPYDDTPREIRFPLEVAWTGYVAPRAALNAAWLVTAAGTVSVATPAGATVLTNPKNVRIPFPLGQGVRIVNVTYAKPAERAPFIRAVLVEEATGRPVPVMAGGAAQRPWAVSATSMLVWLGLALTCGGLGTALLREGTTAPDESLVTRAAGLAATIFLLGWGIVLATASYGSTSFFTAGGDPLYYGSSARDILHHGLLMLHGAPLGQAEPFYFYPMYPYVLALGHALVGDSVSAIFLVNGMLVAMLPALFLALGWSRLRAPAGVPAFAALAAFLWTTVPSSSRSHNPPSPTSPT